MSWISLLIALIMTNSKSANLAGNAWGFQFLTNLVSVEEFFLGLSWVIFFVFLAISIVVFIAKRNRNSFFEFGCVAIALSVWLGTLPLFEWITLLLAKGMLTAFDPVLGIVNQGSFFINAILFLLLGAG